MITKPTWYILTIFSKLFKLFPDIIDNTIHEWECNGKLSINDDYYC